VGFQRLALLVVAACSYKAPTGDDDVLPDAAPGEIELVLDSTDQLTGTPPTAITQLAAITTLPGGAAPGTIETAVYSLGVVRAEGQATEVFTDTDIDADWDAHYDPANIVGTNAFDLGRIAAAPIAIGVPTTNFTVWMQGEMYLEAGQHQLQLVVDNTAFVEVFDTAGVVTVKGKVGSTPVTTFTVATPGWYAFRAAWSDDDLNGTSFRLNHRAPGGNVVPFESWLLRGRIDDLHGALVTGFAERELGRPTLNINLVDPQPFDTTWTGGIAPVFGTSRTNNSSFRETAQMWIADAGKYTFTIDNLQARHRLWIDGAHAGGDTDFAKMLPPFEVSLARGWHDVAVDFTTDADAGHVTLLMTPEGGSPAAIDPALTRPAVGMTSRTVAALDTASHTLAGGIDVAFALAAAPAVTPSETTAVDLAVIANPVDWTQFTVDLVVGAETIRVFEEPLSSRTGSNTLFLHVELPAGIGLEQTWTVRYTSAAATLNLTSLTMHYRGGPEAYPLAATYESPLLDLGNPLALSLLAANGLQPAGTALALEARQCRAVDDCDPYQPADNLPTTPGQLAQIRATLTGDGTVAGNIDSITLRAKPAP